MPDIRCDAIRLNTVCEGADRLDHVLLAAHRTTTDPVTRALLINALTEFGNMSGQLNWWRKEAAEAAREKYATYPFPNWLSPARIGYDSRSESGCGWIATGEVVLDSPLSAFLPLTRRRFAIDMQGSGVMRSMDELRAYVHAQGCDPQTLRIDVDTHAPDALREEIIADGWPLKSATIQDALLESARSWARVDADLAARREERSGRQRLDETEPCADAPEVQDNHLWHTLPDGRKIIPIRLHSEGFGTIGDSDGQDLEGILRKQGAEIDYIAPALSGGGYVGTFSGEMEEVRYRLDAKEWYAYLICSSGVDDWQQEWWVSHTRYTAGAAADAILAARKLADTPLRRP